MIVITEMSLIVGLFRIDLWLNNDKVDDGRDGYYSD